MSEQDVFDALKYRIEDTEYGTRKYYNNAGHVHRENGPAIEWCNGNKSWMQNGLLHRTDGPAIEYINGDKFWYQNGLLHRTDGPAVVGSYGNMEWHINGVEMTEAEFNQAVKTL